MTKGVICVRKKGNITLPVEWRNKYGIIEGDSFSMIDLGGGSVVLTPTISRLVRPGDKVVEILREEGVSLDELLDDLDEERERYYQERYAQN